MKSIINIDLDKSKYMKGYMKAINIDLMLGHKSYERSNMQLRIYQNFH